MKRDPKHQLKYARRVCFFIGLLGLIILFFFNQNIHLVWSGEKYIAKVISIKHNSSRKDHHFQINYDFYRNGEKVQNSFEDRTGEQFLFFISKDDLLTIYESKVEPHSYYIPYAHIAPKVIIAFFFVFIPWTFMIWGKV